MGLLERFQDSNLSEKFLETPFASFGGCEALPRKRCFAKTIPKALMNRGLSKLLGYVSGNPILTDKEGMATILWLRVQGEVFEVERFVLLYSMGFTSLIIHIHLSCRTLVEMLVLRHTSMQDVYEVKLVDGFYFVHVYSDHSVDYLKTFLLNVPVVALGLIWKV
ncbi:hypothetical protein H5410_021209 [Solanum commersonii]|uniref:Uncharacterized protein n=1 Tax=Solanum commersonii TaxID=4109 RepID=A0A9J5ZDK9_SOLCO|nr:hypothetical protein H5410_021209 [Solanum commersonii]